MAGPADSDQERTLPATPRRLEQAREEGQVPRSRSLGSAAVLGAIALALWFGGPAIFAGFTRLMQSGLALDRAAAFDSGAMLARLAAATWMAFGLALPGIAFALAAGVAAPLLVGGWVFSTQSLTPNFAKLDPLAGFARMFSLESLAEVAKVIAEALIVAAVIGWFLWGSRAEIASLVAGSSDGGVSATGGLVIGALLFVVLALAAVAAVDVPLQLWRFAHRLRMTLEEVKQEARESEGDPQLKARVRSLQREMARRRMMESVPKADVVITNPTHFAVALKYDDRSGGAPRVVAKGAELVAARIREVAGAANVPIVEAPPLARALHAHTELGAEVPQALYAAVAQVLAFVFNLRASAAPIPAGGLAMPDLQVPAELDPGAPAE